MAMAAAARRLVRASLVGSLASGDFAAARRGSSLIRCSPSSVMLEGATSATYSAGWCTLSQSGWPSLGFVALLRNLMRLLAPFQARHWSHSIEMVKLRQQQKYYKSAVWVLVSLFAGVAIPGSFANLHLGNDVADLKLGLKAAQDEILQLKRTCRASSSAAQTAALANKPSPAPGCPPSTALGSDAQKKTNVE